MAKNTSPLRIAPLQRVVAEPITDLAEQAALDEQRRRARENGEPLPRADTAPPLAATARLLELSRQLPATERSSLLARLGAELSAEQQMEMLARVLEQLPLEALHSLEGELTARLGARSN